MPTGAHDISQLLATRFQTVAGYGIDRITTVLQNDLAAHNAIMVDMVSGLCDVTTDKQRRYGESRSAEMDEVDEYGRARTQRSRGGSTVGFPLRKFQHAIGWTETWFQEHTPADMAEEPPKRGRDSISSTAAPAWLASIAALAPAAPEPTTSTSVVISQAPGCAPGCSSAPAAA